MSQYDERAFSGMREPINVMVKPKVSPEDKWQYANHVMVTQSPHDFRIMFCDATPPPDAVLKGEHGAAYEHEIPVVAQIVVPHHVMPGFINALKQQFESFAGAREAMEESRGEKKH